MRDHEIQKLQHVAGPESRSMGLFPGMAGLPGTPLAGASLRMSSDERTIGVATGMFLLSMATVGIWLTARIGKGPQQLGVFLVMSFLYAGRGAARIATVLGHAQDWPLWLLSGMRIFMPWALALRSLFMHMTPWNWHPVIRDLSMCC
jgi:hypothetical protein